MDVGDWLRSVGLGEYEAAFQANGVDAAVLPALTADDLREIGVQAVGHRRKLLEAIAALRPSVRGRSDESAGDVEGRAAALPEPPGAERRQLTVLFCDLAGSTALSARLDPEDLREVMANYHRVVTEAIRAQGGYVAKLLGDGLLAYFGWPEAREDDAERAVRAGLAACAAVSRLRAPGAEPLSARVGLATGEVVVGEVLGEGEARERGVVGETPNLAARLQASARAGEVVADDASRRLTGALFAWGDLGSIEVKGLSATVQTWLARGESGVESRFEALRKAAVHQPMLGRDEELELLLRRWRQAQGGEGQVVLVRGEAGIGKSRLVAALQEALAKEVHEELVYDCSPQHVDSALRPVIVRLERAAGLLAGDEAETRLAKLEALLLPLNPPAEDVALIAELLSVPTLGRWAAPDLSPQRRRERLLQAMLRRVQAIAARTPLMVLLEDAHWLDPTTRELLDLLVSELPATKTLLVVTHRPEFRSPWVGETHVTELHVRRLGHHDGAALVATIAGNRPVPEDIVEEIVGRTDGVPLFVEELTRAVLEADEGGAKGILSLSTPSALGVPASLQASLLARLDRLGGAAKEAAQAGAAIGREFPHHLLSAAVDMAEGSLTEAMQRLTASGLVQARGSPPSATYLFKHALVRDVAYGMLLRGRRRSLHARIAQELERRRDEVAERQPEILAHHFTQAGLAEPAVEYWIKAGQLAARASANLEATAHLRSGLALLNQLADHALRNRAELDLQRTLGPVLIATHGYSADGTVAAYERARELLGATGDESGRDTILQGLFVSYCNRGDFRKGLAVAEETLAWAEQQPETAFRCIAHRMLTFCHCVMGDYRSARHHGRRAVDYYEPERHGPLAWRYVHDIGVGARCQAAIGLWHMGEVENAARLEQEALDQAERLRHANTLGYALSYAGVLSAFRRRDHAALARATDRLCAHGRDNEMPQWVAWATSFRAPALTAAGRPDEALDCLSEGVEMCEAFSNRMYRPAFRFAEAEALLAAGRAERALEAIAAGLQWAGQSGETWLDSELLRLRGECRATPDFGRNMYNEADAETAYRTAISCAEGKGDRMFGLRAVTGLARFLHRRGKAAEAHDLLAPVYATFTEGFMLRDLADARALLDELGDAGAERSRPL